VAEGGEEIEIPDITGSDDDVFEGGLTETSLGSIRQELLHSKVEDFYKSIGETPYEKDYDAFEFRGLKRLTHENNPDKFFS
jgi:hypothetical protein